MKEAGSLLVELLENQKVDRVYCVPGESYLSVMNGLQETSIETILCKAVDVLFPISISPV